MAQTNTRRVYINPAPGSSTRPEACFEVTRTHDAYGGLWEYSAELISGDVDMLELEDAEEGAIEQAKIDWACEVES